MAMASSGRSPPPSREAAPDPSPSRLSRNRNKSVMGGEKPDPGSDTPCLWPSGTTSQAQDKPRTRTGRGKTTDAHTSAGVGFGWI